MSTASLWYLQQLDLFSGISPEKLQNIAKNIQIKEYSQHDLLYTPFSDVSALYILKKGEITIYHSHQGKRLILDILKPGSLFGNLSFEKEKNQHFAEASRDAMICVFSRKAFLRATSENPEIVFRILEYSLKRIEEYEEKMKGTLFDAQEKVLHHLSLLQKKQQKQFWFFPDRISVSHMTLAEHTGLSRETVTRAIENLKKSGLISGDKKGYFLNSPKKI